MKNISFNFGGFTFKRIDKRAARRAYCNGLTIIVCPSNFAPFAPFTRWVQGHRLNRKQREHFTIDEIGVKNDFNNLISSFEFYNCVNQETGRYAAYYIPVVTVDAFTGEEPGPGTIHTTTTYDYRYLTT